MVTPRRSVQGGGLCRIFLEKQRRADGCCGIAATPTVNFHGAEVARVEVRIELEPTHLALHRAGAA